MAETTVSLVGSTGSIGTQAIDVVDAEPGRFRVTALAAQRSVDTLVAQAARLRPELVAIGEESLAADLARRLPAGTEVLAGEKGLVAAAQAADVVVNAVVGFAGLPVTLAALESGRRLALANKESLIAGAPVVQPARRTEGALLVPIDSEHCAIHQCLARSGDAELARLLITASGGPFRGRQRDELASISVTEALAHPTWQMGPKITVDSSTLMNKGLEVIEATLLFGLPESQVDVVVHPQSLVHSFVEYADGSLLAQLGAPDMRTPIAQGLAWPERIRSGVAPLNMSQVGGLEFEPPDLARFPSLELARAAARAGGTAPAVLNAANEVAVQAFLDGRLNFTGITTVIDKVLQRLDISPVKALGDVLDADAAARRLAVALIELKPGAFA